MDVILDSNQYLSDPKMEGDKLQSLLRYLLRTKSSLIIPKIVEDEVLARYPEQLRDRHQKLVKSVAALRGFSFSGHLPTIPELDSKSGLAAFQERLREPRVGRVLEMRGKRQEQKSFQSVPSVRTGEYSEIGVEELVRRGVHRVKPASDTGEQFRDVILWLMAMAYAKKTGREVGLISRDGHFFDSAGLHPQLDEEVRREGVRLHVYRTIEDFLKIGASSRPIDEVWIEKCLEAGRISEINDVFEKAVASYLDSGWRPRSEVTSLGETVSKFKKGTLYTLAPDSQYAELEYEGSTRFAVGPYVLTRADPRSFPITDVRVDAEFSVLVWIIEGHITFEIEKMRILSDPVMLP